MDKKTSGWWLRDLDLATKDEEMTWDRILEYSDWSEIGFMGDIAVYNLMGLLWFIHNWGGAFPASTIVEAIIWIEPSNSNRMGLSENGVYPNMAIFIGIMMINHQILGYTMFSQTDIHPYTVKHTG